MGNAVTKEKRHETPFPLEKNLIFEKLEKMWESGWLDSYSEEHFLIRAIKGDVSLEKKLQKQYELCTPNASGACMNLSYTFCANFSQKMVGLFDVFGEGKIKSFVEGQLSAGKENYNEKTFFEALTEIEILLYFIQFGPGWATGTYEPKTGIGNHNPEASFLYPEGTRIDIEVKTPQFPERILDKDIFMPLRCLNEEGLGKFEKACEEYEVGFQRPRVGKLKSFINSACQKFETPLNEQHYNILFINWTYTDVPIFGYIEPVALLANAENGIFLNKDMAQKVEIDEALYEKITAIFVFQNPLESIAFTDLRYLFASRRAVLILNPFILDTKEKRDRFYDSIQMRSKDFTMEKIPDLYFDVDDELNPIVAKALQEIVGENML